MDWINGMYRASAVMAKYGDKSVYFDLEDLGNTTDQWDLYGSDATSPYNSLKEWVTDSPFVISPRITFEVSMRFLGGLMALGYTIATILKRNSHVFSDERVCVTKTYCWNS